MPISVYLDCCYITLLLIFYKKFYFTVVPMIGLGPYAASIMTAMQISCVPQDEFGKIGAARSALVKILPILFNFLYVKVWDMTSMTFPGKQRCTG